MIVPPTRKPGFTLIELLVVISIIALLMALLMPSLSRAVQASRQLQCLNNVRQINTAAKMYLDDNRQYFPWANTVPAWDPKPIWWSGAVAGMGRLPAQQYLTGGSAFYCPDTIKSVTGDWLAPSTTEAAYNSNWGKPAQYVLSQYTYSRTLLQNKFSPAYRISDNTPQNFPVIADAWAAHSNLAGVYWYPHRYEAISVAYLDGSAKYVVVPTNNVPGFSAGFGNTNLASAIGVRYWGNVSDDGGGGWMSQFWWFMQAAY